MNITGKILRDFYNYNKLGKYEILELQWRQVPPCSSWDTGRVAPLFSPGGMFELRLG